MKSKCLINEIGRECSKCWQFKEWDLFNNDKRQSSWKTTACRDCRNKARDNWRATYIGKIKTKNYRIIKRLDPNYRQNELQRNKERRQKTDRYEYHKEHYNKNKIKRIRQRKLREYNQYLKDEKVIYNWNICKILKDYNRDNWILIDVKWIKIFVRKYQVKPYTEKEIKLNLN